MPLQCCLQPWLCSLHIGQFAPPQRCPNFKCRTYGALEAVQRIQTLIEPLGQPHTTTTRFNLDHQYTAPRFYFVQIQGSLGSLGLTAAQMSHEVGVSSDQAVTRFNVAPNHAARRGQAMAV